MAVRGGGHSAFNTMPRELHLDLREYKSVEYNKESQILEVRGGATNAEALRELELANDDRCDSLCPATRYLHASTC